jgi:molybdopterin-guanine dinucleotide biosynthesis protein A
MTTAGVILAGGRGERMGGRAKGLLRIGGVEIIERLLRVFEVFFDEIVISARDPAPYRKFGRPVVVDIVEAHSALAGLHGGLSAVSADYGLVAACDAPFVRPQMLRLLLDRLSSESDVVAPRWTDGRREPLLAIYSKRCLPRMETLIDRGDYKIVNFFQEVRVMDVNEEDLRRADPDMDSFVNVNHPRELGRAVLRAHARQKTVLPTGATP